MRIKKIDIDSPTILQANVYSFLPTLEKVYKHSNSFN